ncbi:MAG: MopE-related protein [bacterium]
MRKLWVQGVIGGLFFLLHFTTLNFMGFRFSSYCFAETNVGGPVRGNVTWSLNKSPYIVKSSISVVSGATLTIEPGVEVRLQEGKAVQVDGTLIARGTVDAKIVFTTYQKSPLVRWGYILFTDSSVDATVDGENYTGGSILEHCLVEYANGGDRQGAVICEKASPLFNYCEIRNNTISGMRITDSSNLVTNCNINNNISASSGAGINASGNSTLTIISSTITNNASGGTSGGGGICFTSPGILTIISSTITNNSAAPTPGSGNNNFWGGGIAANSGVINISSSTVAGNTAKRFGGGIRASGSSITVSNCKIVNNSAEGSGGGIAMSVPNVTITSSTLSSNVSHGAGGGIFGEYCGSTNISYCTIYDNKATSRGGGIDVRGASSHNISHNLFMDNSSTNHGAFISDENSASLKLTNNTFFSNKSGLSGIYLKGTAYTISNNNIYDNPTQYDIYCDNPSASPVLNATNNYWGTEDEFEITERIYDWYDDSSKGKVEYYPFLTAPSPDAPLPAYYLDNDQDGYGDSSKPMQTLTATQGYVDNPNDCNDNDATINPAAQEVCDNMDNDCDDKIDEDLTQTCPDGEGKASCQNGQWVGCCVPTPETCDSKDNDCDSKIDEDLTQTCSTACGQGIETCQNGKWTGCTAPQPQTETCDGKDNDCDNQIDEEVKSTYYADNDKDTYGNPSQSIQACSAPSGYVVDKTDCNDTDNRIHPGAPEIPCNDKDDDCVGGDDCSHIGECVEDNSGTIDIVGTQERVGGEIQIPIRIQSAPGEVNSIGFEVAYDPSILEYTGFEQKDLVASFDMLNINPSGSGRLKVAGFSATGGIVQGASGDLIHLKFKVKSGQENECYPLQLENLKDHITNFSHSSGCFCIHSCNGDLNNDGEITPLDALIAFKCYLGLLDSCPDYADVNQDGEITPLDALCLFQEYLGQPSCLDKQICTDHDGDGFAVEGGKCGPIDCNDSDSATYPGAKETCVDGQDQDCDGSDLVCPPEGELLSQLSLGSSPYEWKDKKSEWNKYLDNLWKNYFDNLPDTKSEKFKKMELDAICKLIKRIQGDLDSIEMAEDVYDGLLTTTREETDKDYFYPLWIDVVGWDSTENSIKNWYDLIYGANSWDSYCATYCASTPQCCEKARDWFARNVVYEKFWRDYLGLFSDGILAVSSLKDLIERASESDPKFKEWCGLKMCQYPEDYYIMECSGTCSEANSWEQCGPMGCKLEWGASCARVYYNCIDEVVRKDGDGGVGGIGSKPNLDSVCDKYMKGALSRLLEAKGLGPWDGGLTYTGPPVYLRE